MVLVCWPKRARWDAGLKKPHDGDRCLSINGSESQQKGLQLHMSYYREPMKRDGETLLMKGKGGERKKKGTFAICHIGLIGLSDFLKDQLKLISNYN